ncbi:MAG: FtsQ-type POTRA domain-containing protein [Firmicutes bacterium]|nr:FtsQ-type POTRA domain-containing protein [Bacillota bacterium]
MDDKEIRESEAEDTAAPGEDVSTDVPGDIDSDIPEQAENGTDTEDAENASSLDVQENADDVTYTYEDKGGETATDSYYTEDAPDPQDTGEAPKSYYTEDAPEPYEIPENESRYFDGEVDEVPPIDIPDEELYRMDYITSSGKLSDEEFKQRKRRRRKNYLLRIGIAILVVVLAIVFMKSDYFMVKKIKIEGNHKYSRAYILKKTDIKKKMNIFFDVDTSDGEKALLSNPYFAEASIERDFPNRIIIKVKERRNAAKIKRNKRYYIIDRHGVLLRKTKRSLKITLLKGVKANRTELGETVTAKNQRLLDRNLKLLRIVRRGDLYFKKMDLTKKTMKLYIKNKLYVRGEWDDITHTIENGNLRKVIYDLKKNHVERGTVTVLKNDYISFGKKLR